MSEVPATLHFEAPAFNPEELHFSMPEVPATLHFEAPELHLQQMLQEQQI